MSEREIIENTTTPSTRQSLVADLENLGVANGDTLLVHSSLSAIGWVCGGAKTLIEALLDSVAPSGTVVMPTFSPDLSNPAHWENPPIPEAWWPTVRCNMPGYNPSTTPTFGMGRVPELFRTWPGALRSAHPTLSFAALGPKAHELLEPHPIDFGLGERSPVARLYNQDARVLFIGCGFNTCTCFHLAEYRAGIAPGRDSAPIQRGPITEWVEFQDIDFDTSDFEPIGKLVQRETKVQQSTIGMAVGKLFSLRAAVDIAQKVVEQRT